MDLTYTIKRSTKRRRLTITVERDRSVVVHAPGKPHKFHGIAPLVFAREPLHQPGPVLPKDRAEVTRHRVGVRHLARVCAERRHHAIGREHAVVPVEYIAAWTLNLDFTDVFHVLFGKAEIGIYLEHDQTRRDTREDEREQTHKKMDANTLRFTRPRNGGRGTFSSA